MKQRSRFSRIAEAFVALAALFALAILITPAIEVDTGPRFSLELVSHPAAAVLPAVLVDIVDQADVLNIYCYENETQVEIPTALASLAEVARYESAQRSGVDTCLDDLSRDDLMRVRNGTTPHPLRC